MRPALDFVNQSTLVGPLALVLAVAFAAPPADAQVTIAPASIDIELQPGDLAERPIVVSIPGATPPAPVDIYFLADTTASMAPALDALKNDVADMLDDLQDSFIDVRFGAGQYRDFPFDEKGDFAFLNDQSLTGDINDVQAAILGWAPGGGPGDVSEAQLYALDHIALAPDPYNIGWRSEAQRIIVWIGDGPGHDPVCSQIAGEKDDVTEASAISRLQDAGITVVAIGTTTGVPNALNGDPAANAGDYLKPCGVIGGSPGQADRIAEATGGLSVQDIGADGIVAAIVALVVQATNTVDVGLIVKGDLGDRITVVTPPSENIPLPPAGITLDLIFIVHFFGLPCEPEIEPDVFVGSLCAVVNGAEAATADVTIRQPVCEAPVAPVRPVALDQVEVITCDVPYEFEFNCRSPGGLPLTAQPAGDPAEQAGFTGQINLDGLTGSYTPPPNTNGLFFLSYVCDDGVRTSNTAQVALWVLTCEEDGGPQTPGQPVPDDGTSSPESDDDCAMGFLGFFATMTGLCLVSGTRRRRRDRRAAGSRLHGLTTRAPTP
jgi:hypothetical protein